MRALLLLIALLYAWPGGQAEGLKEAGNSDRPVLHPSPAAKVASAQGRRVLQTATDERALHTLPAKCSRTGAYRTTSCAGFYYKCAAAGAVPKKVVCPTGKTFYPPRGGCSPAGMDPTCPFQCPMKGKFNTTGCAKFFFKCRGAGAAPLKITCPKGFRYYPPRAGCFQGRPDSACPYRCREAGRFNTTACADFYYECAKTGAAGAAVACPKGASFFPPQGTCKPRALDASCPFLCRAAGKFNTTACARSFYECASPGAVAVKRACPTGASFQPARGVCEPASLDASCPYRCPRAGNFSTSACADFFYKCAATGSTPVKTTCRQGGSFSPKSGVCEPWSPETECPFKCPGAGNFSILTCDSFFYKCARPGATPARTYCGRGKWFYPKLGKCGPAGNNPKCDIGAQVTDCPFFISERCASCLANWGADLTCVTCQPGYFSPPDICESRVPVSCPYKGNLECIAPGYQLPPVTPLLAALDTKILVSLQDGRVDNLLSLLPVEELVALVDKTTDMASCSVPVFVSDLVWILPTTSAIGQLLYTCKFVRGAVLGSSYIWGAMPTLSTASNADLHNLPGLMGLRNKMTDFSACVAIDPCSPGMDVWFGFNLLPASIQLGVISLKLRLQAFGYSKQGTLHPPYKFDGIDVPALWTPDFIGTDSALYFVEGNIFVYGGLILATPDNTVTVENECEGFILMRVTEPVSMAVETAVAPKITLWGTIQMDFSAMYPPVEAWQPGFWEMYSSAVLLMRGGEVWMRLAQEVPILEVIRRVPAIGAGLSKILSAGADSNPTATLDVYSGPSGGAVRVGIGKGATLSGGVAYLLELGASPATLQHGCTVIFKAKRGDTTFTAMIEADVSGRRRLVDVPFCYRAEDCAAGQACHFFVCGGKYPAGAPCFDNSECQSNACGSTGAGRSCKE